MGLLGLIKLMRLTQPTSLQNAQGQALVITKLGNANVLMGSLE